MHDITTNSLNKHIVKIQLWTANLGHIIITMALVSATLLISAYFVLQVYDAFKIHSLIDGFLHALGILLLLWTLMELIQTEIGFLRGKDIDVGIFIEVALVVVAREIIMLSLEKSQPTVTAVAMWVGAAALLGLTYFLLRFGQRAMHKSGFE